ncbi:MULTISPECIES: UDP-glucose dehydrogenase family protein [Geobacillus]|uniref:UDP-glucose 6-dehydrogenase n=1 Tax=Geobacillus thermoleovorans TaxID=33941 RepID=A0A2Z3N6Q5_GEOTH|nr:MULTISPECIES: UDP-glucose/GDP-mannose dehydrogenase family protein [Geobacillus]AWO74556.1 UDP-glucose/GDP-mannose dehydrogenase family protein [Geobacillus thermoleovorans]MBW7643024.1 UDP-glucose/GDP-mannose dehydrogenase family protein [Geobacillus thermoleovorans]MED3722617.1 UDP-glucose/GDP-mannose dehydrogenase family protein [Geobacillus stearothermophilus]MED3769058.1 UDP-glucose/GDP-mannose dehydrogenase family protein [Geobacillus stearothermophilus]MED3772802.1 UDP-glucose/GDP-ma
MKKIAVVGTGYVGLVTGVCLSDIGHYVTCVDIDERKVEKMKQGISPIYEPGLDELMKRNIERGRLHFTTSHEEAFRDAEVIYIAVGTPQKEDGSADLRFVEQAARDIAAHIERDGVVIATKSTVPVGTNEKIRAWIQQHLRRPIRFDVVSNPEFLREGSAIYDTFHGDRIVIGADNERAAAVMEEVNKPFGIPIFHTDIHSAEMIKYASNAFLATKISFINEIANICEKVGANVEDVAYGMGLDTRIGPQFLRAGIGYGGSCFPKDTKALVQIAGDVDHQFELLEAVIKVNNKQQLKLVEKARSRFGSLRGKKVALLGLAFKPNTDDMREAASIVIARELLREGASVVVYDPVAMENAKRIIGDEVVYASSVEEALTDADLAMIVTEWEEIKQLPLDLYAKYMKTPIVFDGRNCYPLEEVKKHAIEYHSIGCQSVLTNVVSI